MRSRVIDYRAEFESTKREHDAVLDEASFEVAGIRATAEGELKLLCGKLGIRYRDANKSDHPEIAHHMRGLAIKTNKVFDRAICRRKALHLWMCECAKLAELKCGDNPGLLLMYDSISVSSYSTQGFGAATYASGYATLVAWQLKQICDWLVVEVICNQLDRSYDVMVGVESKLDVEILKLKPTAITLREWLKKCWAVGCNPRVFNPYLPHGIEAKLGLDYFGGEING